MKVFVTGAAGYIGSVVTENLIRSGHQVAAYDCLKTGHRSAVHPEAQFFEGDLHDPEKLDRALEQSGSEVVMHFAAESVVSESYKDPGIFFWVNTAGGVRLLESMRKAGVSRIVFSSTAAVYGEPDVTPITESSRTVPVNPYGESKLQFEKVLDWYGRIYGFQHVSLRYFNACGATERNGEDRPNETHLIPILLDVANGNRSGFKLFGTDYPTPDGTCVRDYVHVEDIAQGHVLVLEALDQLGAAVYNLGSGEGSTNLQVMEAVERVTGRPIPHEVAERRQGDPAVLVASAKKITRELGWSPRFTTLDEMVESAWQWRQAHPNGYGA